jgi:hypothetical protein
MVRRSGPGMVLDGEMIFINSHHHQNRIMILGYVDMGLDRVKINRRKGDNRMSFGAEFLRDDFSVQFTFGHSRVFLESPYPATPRQPT